MKEFLWGGATASYQCEGGWNEGGRAESMWDKYLHEENLENGDVASDHYHRFKEDIKMMKEGGHTSSASPWHGPGLSRTWKGKSTRRELISTMR